jgi:hypothetical protein
MSRLKEVRQQYLLVTSDYREVKQVALAEWALEFSAAIFDTISIFALYLSVY